MWLRVDVDVDRTCSLFRSTRLYAILATALADTRIASYEAKYYYNVGSHTHVTS
jgi:hypothetical protein